MSCKIGFICKFSVTKTFRKLEKKYKFAFKEHFSDELVSSVIHTISIYTS